MAASGTYNISSHNSYISGYVSMVESDINIANNTSIVTVIAYLRRTNTYSGTPTQLSNKVYDRQIYIDGTLYQNNSAASMTIPNNNSYIEIYRASKTITHNGDGSKTISVSFYAKTNDGSPSAFWVDRTSGSLQLTTIPRYANITSFSVSKRNETSVTFNWSADANCDWCWYSTNNGSSWNNLPSNNIVSGLSVATGYNFKLRVRRTDSQLTTDSGTYYQETYNYPYVTSAPNLTIGNENTISFYNPLGRSCSIYIKLPNNQEWGGDTTRGTSISGYNNNNWKNFWYSGIPNSKSGMYRVRLVCSEIGRDTTVNGGTYYCNDSECKPTYAASNITYYDSNSTVTAITQNNQHIVQNKSNLKVNCSGATAKYSATISSYRAVFNGATRTGTGYLNFGTVNLSNSASVIVTAIDSRGYETSATKEITILSYSSPSAILTAYRLNNYEDESYFKCDATISSVNNKNTMTIQYGYAQGSGSSPTASTNINDNTFVTLSLNKTNEYKFIAKVQDRFETKTFYIVLPKGRFIEFWDTQKLSVGINGFPTHNESLEVFGDLYINGVKLDDYIRSVRNE